MPSEPMRYDEAAGRELAASLDRTVYYVYLLSKGPNWSGEPSPELDALQAAHLGNIRRLTEEGKLVLNGPLLDAFQLGGRLRGIGVLKAASMAEAEQWIGTDPMVQAGHLAVELHAWMVPAGVLP